jgi:hypothetical protein
MEQNDLLFLVENLICGSGCVLEYLMPLLPALEASISFLFIRGHKPKADRYTELCT